MNLIFLLALLVGAVNCSVVVIDSQSPAAAANDVEWWKSGVFYQIYPRSFMDSDGDGEGDIRGITSKLEHLKDLGVTGTWLSPIFKSPMADGGYDISDFTEINPMFGTTADIEALFQKAKQLDIKIILDFVPNHTSDEHEWFKNSVNGVAGFEDFYVWRDCPEVDGKRVYPNNWISVFHNPAWTYNAKRNQCYLHQFVPGQPDLNYRNPKVGEEMAKVLVYWLEKGADGFRVDAINHLFETVGEPDEPYIDENEDKMLYSNINHVHTMNLNGSYEAVFGWRKIFDDFSRDRGTTKKLLMTEAYATLEKQIRWYGNEAKLGSHIPFNFALISNLDENSPAQDFKTAIDGWLNSLPEFGEGNWVLGNHDRPRIAERYGEGRHESLAIMTMLLPGINIVYYGEEILMTNNNAITWEQTDDPSACNSNSTVYRQYTRDPSRTPFQWDDTKSAGFSSTDKTWLPVNSNYKSKNLKSQKSATKSTFKLYKHLIELRKSEVFRNGNFESKAIGQDLFAFSRLLKEEKVVVFINLGVSRTVDVADVLPSNLIPLNARGKILAVTNASPYSSNDYISNPRRFELGRYDAIVLSLESQELTTSPTITTTVKAEKTTPSSGSSIVGKLSLVVFAVLIGAFH